ncbi:MAG: hypothetical protein ABIR96_10825 [Bdellovibrionota bacterium]
MKKSIFLGMLAGLSLASLSANAMPGEKISCRTVDHVEGLSIDFNYNRYNSNLDTYDGAVVLNDEDGPIKIPAKDVVQFKKFGKDLFVKFYQYDSQGVGFGLVINAKKESANVFVGELIELAKVSGDEPEVRQGHARPIRCEVQL